MFEELIKALSESKFVALAKNADGSIRFAGAYNSSRMALDDFSADSPEGMKAIPKVIFVQLYEMPVPPIINI